MKFLFKISAWVLMLALVTAAGPNDDEPCIQDLKACLTKMSQLTLPKGSKAYYMHMGIVKKMSPGSTIPDTDADVTLIISEKQMHYETQVLSVYKDEKDAFTILHPSRQIVRTTGSKIPYSENALAEVSKLQLKMLAQCSMASCKSIDKDGNKLKQLVLLPNETLRKNAQVKTMTFTYDPKQQSLREIETKYLPGQSMINEKVSIYNTDMNYKEPLPESAFSKVFNSSGKLLSKYKGYKIVDQR